MSRNTANGDLIVAGLGTIISYYSTTTTAPGTAAFPGAVTGQIAALSSGGSTSAIYHFNGSAWVDTSATVAHLYGKST
jgi:hypothetical protein